MVETVCAQASISIHLKLFNRDAKIHQNVARLTHFIEESNTGKGFIKEQCFSPCGR